MNATDPSPSIAPSKSKLRPRRLLLLVALCLATVLSYSVWLPLLVLHLLPPAAPYFGYTVKLAAVDRCDFSGLEVRGLQVTSQSAQTPLQMFRADSLQLGFDSRLLRGELSGLRSANAEAWQLELNNSADESPAAPQGETSFLTPLTTLPEVELLGGAIVLDPRGSPTHIQLTTLRFSNGSEIEVDSHFDERHIQATAAWQSQALNDLAVFVDGRPLVNSTTVELEHLGQGAIRVDAQLPLGSKTQTVHLDLSTEGMEWQGSVQGLELGELMRRLPINMDFELKGKLDLETKGQLSWAHPMEATFKAQLNARDLWWNQLPIEHVSVQMQMQDSELQLPDLLIKQSLSNHLHFEGAVLPLQDLDPTHWMQSARAQVSLVIEDSYTLLDVLSPDPDRRVHSMQHHIELEAALAHNRLEISKLELLSEAGNLRLDEGSVQLGGADKIRLDAAGKAEFEDLARVGELFGRQDWDGSMAGSINVQGIWPQLGGDLKLMGNNLVLEGMNLGQLQLELGTPYPGAPIEVSQFQIETAAGTASAQLRIFPTDKPRVAVQQLELMRGQERLALVNPAEVSWSAGEGSCSPLLLEGEGGRVELRGTWANDSFEIALGVSELHPNFINGNTEQDTLKMDSTAFQFKASRESGHLQFNTQGSLNGWHPPQWPEPIDLSWAMSHEAGQLEIQKLHAQREEEQLLLLSGTCPLSYAETWVFGTQDVDISLEALIPLAMVQVGGQGSLHAAGHLLGSWAAIKGQLDLKGTGLRLAPEWHPEELASGALQGHLRLDQGLHLEETSISLGEWIDCQLEGEVSIPMDIPQWLSNPQDMLEQGEIEAHLNLARLDIEPLRPLLESLSESFTTLRTGQLKAQLDCSGPITTPRWSGRLQLEQGRVRTTGGLPALEELEGELVLQENRILVQALTGSLGAADFQVKGDVQWVDNAALLNLELQGEDLLLFRSPEARIRANTHLQLQGPLSRLLVAGKLELTTGRYKPELEFLNLRSGPKGSNAVGFQLFTFRDAPLRDMSFDIELTSSGAFALRNTILNGSMRPRLHLGGTGLLPILNGTVYVDPTRLKLPAAQLELSAGTIRFLESNPFVPELDLRGRTRILGYDIRADISGAYDDPELLLSSTPPLGQEDLFLLLLTGRLPEDPSRNDVLSTANTVALYLAKDTLARWFADDGPLDEDSLLERLEFSLGQDVSKNGTETFDVAVRLTRRMGKSPDEKDRRHAYVVAERDKYEDHNYGLRWVFRFKR